MQKYPIGTKLYDDGGVHTYTVVEYKAESGNYILQDAINSRKSGDIWESTIDGCNPRIPEPAKPVYVPTYVEYS